MANINEILARAAALRDETALNSIDPERAGGIMYDTLMALNELWLQQGAALVISKIYASVAAMNADTSPVSDLTGQPIRPGMIVVIASSDTDNGSVYRYNGTSAPRWSLVGNIGNLEPVDSLDSDSTQLPLAAHQGKVLDGKISQLGQDVYKAEIVSLSDGVYPYQFVTGETYIITNNGDATITVSHRETPSGTSHDIVYIAAKKSVEYTPTSNGNYLRYGDACNLEVYKVGSVADVLNKTSETSKVFDKYFRTSTNVCSGDIEYAGKVVRDNGNIETESGYNTSYLFPIMGNATYKVNGIIFLAYYDESKTFISRPNISDNSVTTPINACYARISSWQDVSIWQLNEGSTLLSYEKPSYLMSDKVSVQTDNTLTKEGISADALGVAKNYHFIPLSVIAQDSVPSQLNIGEYGFNSTLNIVIYKIGSTANVHYIELLPDTNARYIYGGELYRWNGSLLVKEESNPRNCIVFSQQLEPVYFKNGITYRITNNNPYYNTLSLTNDNSTLNVLGTIAPYTSVDVTPNADYIYLRSGEYGRNAEVIIETVTDIEQDKKILDSFKGINSEPMRFAGSAFTAANEDVKLLSGIGNSRFNLTIKFAEAANIIIYAIDRFDNRKVLRYYIEETPTVTEHKIYYDGNGDIEDITVWSASTQNSVSFDWEFNLIPQIANIENEKRIVVATDALQMVPGSNSNQGVKCICNGKAGKFYRILCKLGYVSNKIIGFSYILADGTFVALTQRNNTTGIVEHVFKSAYDFVGLHIWHASTADTTKAIITVEEVNIDNKYLYKNDYQFGLGIDCKYNVPLLSSSISNITCEYFYSLYDALVTAYPGYIEKIDCDAKMISEYGLTRPTELEDLPIFMYKFKPPYTPNSAELDVTQTDKSRLKVMIVTGTHPEYTAIYDCYCTMKEICDNWANDDNLDALRWEAEYYIIPCSNPYGIENRQRCNYNDVDLNRNAPSNNWYYGGTPGDDYSGSEPNSEYETRLMVNMFKEIEPQIFIDHHNFSSGQHEIYITSQTTIGKDIGAAHISAMSRRWKKRFDTVFPQNDFIFGFAQITRESGTRSTFACDYGALGFTYESSAFCGWVNGEYDAEEAQTNTPFVCTLATDGFLNFLLRVLKSYSDRENW